MDKKKVNDLMEEYSRIPRRDPSEDLKKFYARQNTDKKPTKKCYPHKKLIWSGITFVVAIMVAFAVILPIYFSEIIKDAPNDDNGQIIDGDDQPSTDDPGDNDPPDDPDPIDEPHYFSDDAILYSTIDSIESFNAQYQCAVKAVTDVGIQVFKVISDGESGSVLGLQIMLVMWDDMTTWSETIDQARIFCYTGNDRIQDPYYYQLALEADYNGMVIHYRVDNENDWDYRYYMEFTQDDILYNIEIDAYEDIGLKALLDEIFAA